MYFFEEGFFLFGIFADNGLCAEFPLFAVFHFLIYGIDFFQNRQLNIFILTFFQGYFHVFDKVFDEKSGGEIIGAHFRSVIAYLPACRRTGLNGLSMVSGSIPMALQ